MLYPFSDLHFLHHETFGKSNEMTGQTRKSFTKSRILYPAFFHVFAFLCLVLIQKNMILYLVLLHNNLISCLVLLQNSFIFAA
jgi:hypothetical protein